MMEQNPLPQTVSRPAPPDWRRAMARGTERLCAWSDLLDRINVFPVADGDTGRNLAVSLAPLRRTEGARRDLKDALLLAGRGNSGNIATRFFSALLAVDQVEDLPGAVREGRNRAWEAVHDPKPGTILSVFDAVAAYLETEPAASLTEPAGADALLARLEETVCQTAEELPRLRQAGVVDAGALGAYLFFEGFFRSLAGDGNRFRSVPEAFRGRLRIRSDFQERVAGGYCIDLVVRGGTDLERSVRNLTNGEESVVVIREGDRVKLHLHAADQQDVKNRLASVGRIEQWSVADLGEQIREFGSPSASPGLHLMTDAAGSLTRADARALGLTLLDSYITLGERSLPETHFHPNELYQGMREGTRATTSQASLFERHQRYESVLALHEQVLYLCVGSVYTGNCRAAGEWKAAHDPEDRLWILDTGAASGRLAVIVRAAVRAAAGETDARAAVQAARDAMDRSEEYIFIDTLRYLAAGGRLSKTGTFFGDMLKMKPVISPLPEGAQKVGLVRNRNEQLAFALGKLAKALRPDGEALILLQYTDTQAWIEETVFSEVSRRYPRAEILVRPASLTSGVHFGPGSWALAFLSPP